MMEILKRTYFKQIDIIHFFNYQALDVLFIAGYSQCVLKPKTTKEVSEILTFCNEHRIAVCPQGGNTGLVGGSVPVFDEVVLSTALMNEIISTDDTSGTLIEIGLINGLLTAFPAW